MKKKKIIAIIVILLLVLFGFKCLKNKWMSNKDKNITIEETKEEKQKENKNKISKNEKERKDNKKDLNNMKDKKSNNKFNNNFTRDNVDRRTDIRPIKPGEFPIEHDGNINDNQNGGNQKDKTGTNNPGKGSQEQNTQKPDKSGNKKPEISKPVNPDTKKPEVSKPENPDTKKPEISKPDRPGTQTPEKPKNPKPDNPEEGVIEQEELEKEKLSKLLTIFTKNYRVNEGLVFNSKNKNKLPDEAYIGFKATGENDGKLHKINWSGDQLEDVKANKPGKYQLKVEVEDEISIAEKNFENISFYVDIVIK